MKSLDGIVICSFGIIIFLISLLGNMPMSGELIQDVSAANVTLNEAYKNSENFIKLQMANGQIKKFPTRNLYWFAKLYDYTTFLEIEKLKSVEHPAMVAHFIPIFFGLYKQAVDSYQSGNKLNIPDLWMRHFKTSGSGKITLSVYKKRINEVFKRILRLK